MTTLEIILSVILYTVCAIYTGVKDKKDDLSIAPIIIGIFFPITWIIIITRALFWSNWSDL